MYTKVTHAVAGLLLAVIVADVNGMPSLAKRQRREAISQDKIAKSKSLKPNNNRVVNGWDASSGQFPWMVHLDLKSNDTGISMQHLCGGVLIEPDIVLTAAHCFSNEDGTIQKFYQMKAYVGLTSRESKDTDSGYVVRAIDCIFRHPDFNPIDYTKDIALLKLSAPVNNVKLPIIPVSFSAKNYFSRVHNQDTYGKLDLLGWGSVNAFAPDDDIVTPSYPDTLQHGKIHLYPSHLCVQPEGPYQPAEVTTKTLCGDTGDGVSGADACIGDSGGPLFFENQYNKTVIVGIVSSGIGCAAAGYPGLYTKTSAFSNWITRSIESLSMCTEGDGAEIKHESQVGVTRGGCKCEYLWAVNDGTCSDGEATYNHCGMIPSCDGDNMGNPNQWSWCFISEESKSNPDCASVGSNWDYCEIGLGICQVNHYASAGTCHPCEPGSTREAGDNPQLTHSFNDNFITTSCDVTVCQTNEYVESNKCKACPAGTQNAEGDYATGEDTSCNPIQCGPNRKVKNNACVPCEAGYSNPNQDYANGPDTECVEDSTTKASPVSTQGNSDANSGCTIPNEPLSYFTFLANARLKGSKNYNIQSIRLRAGVWQGGEPVHDLSECAARCIAAGNACLAFEMNDRKTVLQCDLLSTGPNKVGGVGAPKGTWHAYQKTTFCGDYVTTTEEPQTIPVCPGTYLERFRDAKPKRLKKTYLYTLGGTGVPGGGRHRTTLEGCAQLCIEAGKECRSFEFKEPNKCEMKIYNSLDTAIKPNAAWKNYDKEMFECE